MITKPKGTVIQLFLMHKLKHELKKATQRTPNTIFGDKPIGERKISDFATHLLNQVSYPLK